ncbi:hypothetical protein ACWGB8_21520 [Kitasatospora sp. NPDC054939]
MPKPDDSPDLTDSPDLSDIAGLPHRPGLSVPPGRPVAADPSAQQGFPDRFDLTAFLGTSAALTGVDEHELRATGLAEEHCRRAAERLGTVTPAPGTDAARELTYLWYAGTWPDGSGAGAHGYRAGLMWRTLDTDPPDTTVPGHSPWPRPPRPGAR